LKNRLEEAKNLGFYVFTQNKVHALHATTYRYMRRRFKKVGDEWLPTEPSDDVVKARHARATKSLAKPKLALINSKFLTLRKRIVRRRSFPPTKFPIGDDDEIEDKLKTLPSTNSHYPSEEDRVGYEGPGVGRNGVSRD
jgi:hypothetical protein